MSRMLAMVAVLAAALCFADAGSADPSHNLLPDIVLTCSDQSILTVIPGTSTNNSSIAFVRDDTSIFVARSFTLTLDGETVFGFERGLSGFSGKNLVTCTGPWTLGGVTYEVTVTGFVTPAQL